MNTPIQLSDHFDYKRLLRFTLPSIAMMIFTSIYGVVDGLFVSNFVGKTSFAALNFIMPVVMVLGMFGFMFGTGGSALVAKTLGEGKKEKANELFSLIIYTSFLTGLVILVFGEIFIRRIAILMGAEGEMLENCVTYASICFLGLPFFMLQYGFQSFCITAEKPNLSFIATLGAGCMNMVLDALFVGVFRWGLKGAASATILSQAVGAIIPLVYFLGPQKSLLHLGKTHFDSKALLKTITNGSSELMSNISMSTVSMLYNLQLMKAAGEDGVSAYGVLMYVNMIFIAVFIGYSIGTAPITGFNFGAENTKELQNVFKRSLVILGTFGILMFLAAEAAAGTLSSIFVGYDADLKAMTEHAFRITSFSFLLSGYCIYGSSFFTALNDGLTSAIISFLRSLVFQVAAILILPIFLGLNGIWISIVVAEIMSFLTTLFFLVTKRNKFHYWKEETLLRDAD